MALGGGGLNPQNKNIASTNEMKPISTFGLGLMFFTSFVSTKLMGYRIQNNGKKPAAGGNVYFASKNVGSNFRRNYIPPPNQKILATFLTRQTDYKTYEHQYSYEVQPLVYCHLSPGQ